MDTITKVENRTETIRKWYAETFPKFGKYVYQRGGTLDEAKELFQEAVIAYYEKLNTAEFTPLRSDEAYLFGIARKKWLKYHARKRHHEDFEQVDILQEANPIPNPQLLLNHLKKVGEKCLNILQAYYYENLSMNELASRFGYSSERSATVQKYKCLEKVRDEIKQKKMTYEDFLS